MKTKLCSFNGCKNTCWAKGLCNTHWAQQARHGKLWPIITDETADDRFERYISRGLNEDDCWEWTGTGKGSGKGYGQLYFDGKKWMAHRFSYEKYIGPIPSEIQIDHKCRNKKCVNPKHLEAVTQKENMDRMNCYHSMKKRIDSLEEFVISLGYNPTTLKKK